MITFEPSNTKWWSKPLVKFGSKDIPAELAVLQSILEPGEYGVWMNSRGLKTGVIGFREQHPRTIRQPLPEKVADRLRHLYKTTSLKKGCPDLVIWKDDGHSLRFVEVKCPHWDRPSPEQVKFLNAAKEMGIKVSICEWQFARDTRT